MTVRTKHIGNSEYEQREGGAEKVAELGGKQMDKEVTRDDDNIVIIRSWPSMESAQAWCDYVLPFEHVISAEILED